MARVFFFLSMLVVFGCSDTPKDISKKVESQTGGKIISYKWEGDYGHYFVCNKQMLIYANVFQPVWEAKISVVVALDANHVSCVE